MAGSATILYDYSAGPSSQGYVKLWDGITAYASAQGGKNVSGSSTIQIGIPCTLVTLGSTTTLKISAASQGANGAVYKMVTRNNTGITGLASWIVAVKIV